LIEIESQTAEKNSAQANRQTNRHYENNGHLAANQKEGRGGEKGAADVDTPVLSRDRSSPYDGTT